MNTGQRLSKFIDKGQAENLLAAGHHAYSIGRPLNRSMTVHCGRAGIDMDGVHDFVTNFFKHAGDWLRRNTKEPPFYIWTLEAPPHRGLHMHALVYVPDLLTEPYLRLQRRWVMSAGAKRKDRVLRSKRVWYSRSLQAPREFIDYGLGGILSYMLKGTAPSSCAAFHIQHRNQGLIIGKRCGTSRALGEKARRQWSIAR